MTGAKSDLVVEKEDAALLLHLGSLLYTIVAL